MKDYFYYVITDQKEGFIASLLKTVLFICSFLYGFVVAIMYFCYRYGIFRRYKSSSKVISVGNITWGGTGKTPMVELLVKFLKDKNHKVVILSRGYKRANKRDENLDNLGDESYLLAKKLSDVPILVGRDRINNAKKAIREYKPDTIILDDGFQHWRMNRDLDIVMVDTMNPFGDRYILPRGILREPIKSLKRAQILVLTKTDLAVQNLSALKDRLIKINPEAFIVESIHKPLGFYKTTKEELPLSFAENKNVCLVAGIADPPSFEKTVINLGAKVGLRFFFPDHHQYKENDVKNIMNNCKRLGIDTIVVTEKDMIKLDLFPDITVGLIALRIKLEIMQEKEFYARLLAIYNC